MVLFGYHRGVATKFGYFSNPIISFDSSMNSFSSLKYYLMKVAIFSYLASLLR